MTRASCATRRDSARTFHRARVPWSPWPGRISPSRPLHTPLLGSAPLTGRSCLLMSQGPARVKGATSGQAAPSPRPVNLPSSLHLVAAFTDSFLCQQTRQSHSSPAAPDLHRNNHGSISVCAARHRAYYHYRYRPCVAEDAATSGLGTAQRQDTTRRRHPEETLSDTSTCEQRRVTTSLP